MKKTYESSRRWCKSPERPKANKNLKRQRARSVGSKKPDPRVVDFESDFDSDYYDQLEQRLENMLALIDVDENEERELPHHMASFPIISVQEFF